MTNKYPIEERWQTINISENKNGEELESLGIKNGEERRRGSPLQDGTRKKGKKKDEKYHFNR